MATGESSCELETLMFGPELPARVGPRDRAGALLQGGGEEVAEEGAELHEALVRDHRPSNLPALHVERGDQMNGPAPFVGMLEVCRLVPPRWRVGGVSARLDGRLLVDGE